jgi:hypothetical protein
MKKKLKPTITVAVRKRDGDINAKRKAYMTDLFPQWALLSYEQGDILSEAFIELSAQLAQAAIEAQVSITGQPWPEDDLDRLRSRGVGTFPSKITSPIRRMVLINHFENECYRQGIIDKRPTVLLSSYTQELVDVYSDSPALANASVIYDWDKLRAEMGEMKFSQITARMPHPSEHIPRPMSGVSEGIEPIRDHYRVVGTGSKAKYYADAKENRGGKV